MPYTMHGEAVPSSSTTWTGPIGQDIAVADDGRITALRFYRHSADSGPNPRTLYLWNSSGTLLGSATAPGTGAGWKTATLATPVPVAAGATVRVSYDGAGNVARSLLATGAKQGDLTLGQGYISSTPAGTRPVDNPSGNDWVVDFVLDAYPAPAAAPTTGQLWPRGNW